MATNCPKGDIRLAFCPDCAHITNLDFEPARLEYSTSYNASLHYSPYFQDYARTLASRLIKRHNLYNKDIIDIGCGNGFFLSLLCKLGNNRGVGFDPAYNEKEHNSKEQVTFIQDYYSEKYENYQSDLIVCRQVLEHIQNPSHFIGMVRKAIGNRNNTRVFFEVPNALLTFEKLFVWDIIYEHCSYFTSYSLSQLFSSCGFRVCELSEEYNGQFLSIDALPDNKKTSSFNLIPKREQEKISDYIESFPNNYQNIVEKSRLILENTKDKGQRVVTWGAGSKGVMFLNTIKNSEIEYVVDINPNKQEMYIPGTGQKIVPPKFLQSAKPDVIILMNPIYKNEVKELIKKLMLPTKILYFYTHKFFKPIML